jgi:TolB-like protein
VKRGNVTATVTSCILANKLLKGYVRLMIGDRDAVLSALQSVLKSKHFAQSESLSNLLRHIVEASLAGRGPELKEYILGREVFGRGDSFDPKTDTIVRVQASRLRSKLRDYYAAEGGHDGVVISVPTGAYSAQFLANGNEHARKERVWFPKWIAVAGAAAFVAAGAYRLGNRARTAVLPAIRSVAVLPFRNLSGDPAQDYLADGLTDNLITDLGKTPDLRVISRTTAMSYTGTRKSLSTVARELDVDALVEGSMTLSGENLRVNANLIDARGRERSLWTRTLEHGARDIAGLQREMYGKVAHQLRPESKALPPDGAASPNPDAYAAYLKGRYFAAQSSEAAHGQALEWFAKATALDPRLSIAKAGEALSYSALADFYLPPREAAPRAKAAANQALALDSSSAEAYMARGSVELFFDWPRPPRPTCGRL